MKPTEAISKSMSIVDDVLENKGRKNIIGTFITGIGLTITSLGIAILANKPENNVSRLEKSPETT